MMKGWCLVVVTNALLLVAVRADFAPIGAEHNVQASVTIAGHQQIDTLQINIRTATSLPYFKRSLAGALTEVEGASAFSSDDELAVRWMDADGVLNAVR